MEVLALNRHLFVLLWFFPTPEHKSKWFRLRNILFSLGCFTFVSAVLLASICFAFKNFHSSLEATVYAFSQITAYVAQVYLMLVGYIFCSNFSGMFNALQRIYDESKRWVHRLTYKVLFCTYSITYSIFLLFHFVDKDADKFRFIQKANERAEFYAKFFTQYLLAIWFAHGPIVGLISVFYSLIKYEYINVDSMYFPYVLVWVQLPVDVGIHIQLSQ